MSSKDLNYEPSKSLCQHFLLKTLKQINNQFQSVVFVARNLKFLLPASGELPVACATKDMNYEAFNPSCQPLFVET